MAGTREPERSVLKVREHRKRRYQPLADRHHLNINAPLMSLTGDKPSRTGYGWRVEGSGFRVLPVCGREQRELSPKGKSPEISQAKEP